MLTTENRLLSQFDHAAGLLCGRKDGGCSCLRCLLRDEITSMNYKVVRMSHVSTLESQDDSAELRSPIRSIIPVDPMELPALLYEVLPPRLLWLTITCDLCGTVAFAAAAA